MNCKKCGFENEKDAKFCGQCGESLSPEEVKEDLVVEESKSDEEKVENNPEASEKTEELVQEAASGAKVEESEQEAENATEWYYAHNGQSMGPYTESVMKEFGQQGVINLSTYVWTQGMDEWKLASQTPLAKYVKPSSPTSMDASANHPTMPAPSMVTPRSIPLFVILSLLTCGIVSLVWIYLIAVDVNTLAKKHGREAGPDPIVAVILTIFTCGIYSIYFYYKEATILAGLKNKEYVAPNLSILCLAMPLIQLGVISQALLQDEINKLATNE